MSFFELSGPRAALEQRLFLKNETVDRKDIDRQKDDEGQIYDVVQDIKSARVIDRLVDEARKDELESGTCQRQELCQREKDQDKKDEHPVLRVQRLSARPEARPEHACEVGLPPRSSDGKRMQESRDLKQRKQCYDDREDDHHEDRYGVEQNMLEVIRRNVRHAADLHHGPDQDLFEDRRGDRGKERAEQDKHRSFNVVALKKAQDLFEELPETDKEMYGPVLSDGRKACQSRDLSQKPRKLNIFRFLFSLRHLSLSLEYQRSYQVYQKREYPRNNALEDHGHESEFPSALTLDCRYRCDTRSIEQAEHQQRKRINRR